MNSLLFTCRRISMSVLLQGVFFLLGSQILLGQGWTQQISGTTSNLNRVDFWSSTQGYVVGENGRILSTTDGGTNWNLFTSSPVQFFYGVAARSATHATVSGGNGTILVTTNGGTTWSPQTSGTTAFLYDCGFADANTGWVVGASGVIRKTTDGGTTWNPQTSGTTNYFSGCFFLDTQTGWAVGTVGTIRKTTNGGTTWSAQTSGVTDDLYDVTFNDANNGIAVGFAGRTLKTTDGGTTWSPVVSGTNQSVQSVEYTSPTDLWVSRANGRMNRSTDGGDTWFVSPVASNTLLLDGLHFQSPSLGWVVGNSGTIYKFECNTTTATDVQQSCGPFTWIDGNTYAASNNSATHTISNYWGCDSVVTLDLTVVNVDTSVTEAGQTLSANQAGATYQWVVCDSVFTPVPNETSQVFVAASAGNFAVEITLNGCTSMSGCHTVLPIGIQDGLAVNLVRVYPNPAKGMVNVELSEDAEMMMMDVFGRVVLSQSMTAGKQEIDLQGLSAGTYFVRATSVQHVQNLRLIVQ